MSCLHRFRWWPDFDIIDRLKDLTQHKFFINFQTNLSRVSISYLLQFFWGISILNIVQWQITSFLSRLRNRFTNVAHTVEEDRTTTTTKTATSQFLGVSIVLISSYMRTINCVCMHTKMSNLVKKIKTKKRKNYGGNSRRTSIQRAMTRNDLHTAERPSTKDKRKRIIIAWYIWFRLTFSFLPVFFFLLFFYS